ncbi:hypothetical protein R4Q14_10230 [Brachyspira intermedia]
MIEYEVTSEPVPLVVGITINKGFLVTFDIFLFTSEVKYITAFAVSITEPPPIVIIVSELKVKIYLNILLLFQN